MYAQILTASERNREFFDLLTFFPRETQRGGTSRERSKRRIPLVEAALPATVEDNHELLNGQVGCVVQIHTLMLPVNLGMLGSVASVGDIYVGKKGTAECCCCCLPAGPRALRSPLCLLCG